MRIFLEICMRFPKFLSLSTGWLVSSLLFSSDIYLDTLKRFFKICQYKYTQHVIYNMQRPRIIGIFLTYNSSSVLLSLWWRSLAANAPYTKSTASSLLQCPFLFYWYLKDGLRRSNLILRYYNLILRQLGLVISICWLWV